MVSGLINNFPKGYSPNPQQVRLLKNIDQGFKDGHKYIVCNAPTGSGKSFISKTIGNIANTPTKEFKDLINHYLAYRRSHGGGYAYEDDCSDEKPFGCTALTITKALQDQYRGIER